jgi:hypothetical protein
MDNPLEWFADTEDEDGYPAPAWQAEILQRVVVEGDPYLVVRRPNEQPQVVPKYWWLGGDNA